MIAQLFLCTLVAAQVTIEEGDAYTVSKVSIESDADKVRVFMDSLPDFEPVTLEPLKDGGFAFACPKGNYLLMVIADGDVLYRKKVTIGKGSKPQPDDGGDDGSKPKPNVVVNDGAFGLEKAAFNAVNGKGLSKVVQVRENYRDAVYAIDVGQLDDVQTAVFYLRDKNREDLTPSEVSKWNPAFFKPLRKVFDEDIGQDASLDDLKRAYKSIADGLEKAK